MYKYYKIVQSEEHMLYAKEIAILYGILNKNNAGDAVKVSKIIKQYLIDNKIGYEQLYYNTKYGLSKVYPESIYKPAMEQYLKLKEKEN